MSDYVPYPIATKIFIVFKNVPMTSVTDLYLNAVSSYTKAILRNIQRRKVKKEMLIKDYKKHNKDISELPKDLFENNFELYDLNILWNIIIYSKTDPKIDLKLKDLAINFLVKTIEDNDELLKFNLKTTLENIKSNNDNVVRYVKFFCVCYKIIKKKVQDKRYKLIKKFIIENTDGNIINEMIERFYKYKNKIKFDSDSALNNSMSHV